jgi:hypothetical protein
VISQLLLDLSLEQNPWSMAAPGARNIANFLADEKRFMLWRRHGMQEVYRGKSVIVLSLL